MATTRGRSSAPLFAPVDDFRKADNDPGDQKLRATTGKYTQPGDADEVSGFPSRELGVDPFTESPGSNQFLGHQANDHGYSPSTDHTWQPTSDMTQRLPDGSFPIKSESLKYGKPSAVSPAGEPGELSRSE